MLDRQNNLLSSRPGRTWIASALVLLVLASAPAIAQPESESLGEIRAELGQAFETLPLSDGWLLRPLAEDPGFQTIEVRGSELAIDGTIVSSDEVRARLDGLADPVIAFAELDIDAQRSVFDEPAEEVLAEAEMEAEEMEAAAREARDEARAERSRRREKREVNRTDAQVVVGSSVTVEEDEVTREVVVVGGSLSVDGLVKGDAVAVGGSVEIEGEVTGDVAAIGSSVSLGENALVGGDVVSVGGTVDRAEGAVIEGDIEEVPFPSFRISSWSGPGSKKWHGPDVSVDFSPARGAFSFAWELFGIAVLVLLAALTLLVAKNPVERVGEQVADEPWKSGLVGLLCQILFFPLLILVILILVVSIVGIPFLLLLPFALLALLLIGLMGYTAVALRIGRWSEERFRWSFASPFLALLVGIGLLEVWSLLGDLLGLGPGPIKFFAVMFAFFGALVCYAAWTVGFGGAVLSRFGSTPKWSGGGDESASWEAPASAALDSPAPTEEPFSPDIAGEEGGDWTVDEGDGPGSSGAG